MSSSFFMSLPREIRDLIYIDALSSATGLVTFCCDKSGRAITSAPPLNVLPVFAFDPAPNEVIHNERILFSLLQVSRQAYEECKDIFWKHNTFRIQHAKHFTREGFFAVNQSLVQHFWPKLRKVELLFVPRRRLMAFHFACNALPTLLDWSMKGNLKKVVLVMDLRGDLRDLLDYRYQVMERFWPAGDNIHYLLLNKFKRVYNNQDGQIFASYVEKRIVLKTGFPTVERDLWLENSLSLQHGGFLAGLHAAFGGELVIDGHLISRDSVKV